MTARAVPYAQLASAADATQPALVISISDPGEAPADHVLRAAIGDVPVVRLAYHAHSGPNTQWITPSGLQPVADAVKALPKDAFVLVHCSAGLMRSPAVALFVRALRLPESVRESDQGMADLVAAWRADHPNAEPHQRTLGCADVLLDMRRHGLELAVAQDDERRATAANPTPQRAPSGPTSRPVATASRAHPFAATHSPTKTKKKRFFRP